MSGFKDYKGEEERLPKTEQAIKSI